jgi:hypothetical protein
MQGRDGKLMAKSLLTRASYYSLAQALAFLIYRRADGLPSSFSAFDVLNEAVRSEDPRARLLAPIARAELLDALTQGKLLAHGIRDGANEHEPILATAWRTIDPLLNSVTIPPNAIGAPGDARARYFEVVINADDVRALWPKRLTVRPASAAREVLTKALDKGIALTTRQIDDLRSKECPNVPRERFRQIARELQGPRPRGRPRSLKNAPK